MFWSNAMGGPQANFGQMVRGDHTNAKGGPQALNFRSNAKGGPQALNFGQMLRGAIGTG